MDINWTSPLCFTSYGMSALNTLLELDKAGHSIAFWPIGQVEAAPEYHDVIGKWFNNQATYNSSATSTRLYHQFSLDQHVGKGRHVGWPIFELDLFNDRELHHLRSQDELIVCSQWGKDVLRQNGMTQPIHVVPLGVDTDLFPPRKNDTRKLTKRMPGTASFTTHYVEEIVDKNKTVFITVGKKEVRKIHDLLKLYFEKAFCETDNCELWIVWGNRILDHSHPKESKQWTEYYKSSKLASKIRLFEWLPSQLDVNNLLASADCFLGLSRAEGFNLDLLEALSKGLPVITNFYSGHTEFITDKNAMIIPFRANETATDGIWFHGYGDWMAFGKQEEEQIISYMRQIHKRKQEGDNLFNAEGVKTAKQFSWQNTALRLIEALAR